MLECRGEKHFKNLEKCNEIQGEITSKTVYPIRYPCYIGEISLKTSNNFETEEKKIQLDSGNNLQISQNYNYNSNDNFQLENKNKCIDNTETNLSENKNNSKDNYNNELKENFINEKIEKETNKEKNNNKINDENINNKNVIEIDKKNDNIRNIEKPKEIEVYKEDEETKNLNNNNNSKKEHINNITSNSYDNLKNLDNEIDYYYNQILNNKKESNKNDYSNNNLKKSNYTDLDNFNNNKNIKKEYDLKNNDYNLLYKHNNNKKIYFQNILSKSPDLKYNNNLYKKDIKNKKDYYKSPKSTKEDNNIKKLNKLDNNRENKINCKNQKNIFNIKSNKKNINILNKLQNDKLKMNKNKLKIKYNRNNNFEKNNNINNNFKRYSFSNKNNYDDSNMNMNNSHRFNTFSKTNLINNNKKKYNNGNNLYGIKKEKKAIKSSNSSKNKLKNDNYQNLILSLTSDSSVITNSNQKSLQILKRNDFLQNNYKRKIKEQIPVYRLLSPENKAKNKRRITYLTGKKKIYSTTRTFSGTKNFNLRDDVWDYFNTNSYLNTSKNKKYKNIINITRNIPHSHSDNIFNLTLFNTNREHFNINHRYNNSMYFNDENLINNLYKNNYDSDDTEEKILYDYNKNNNKKYIINFQKKNKIDNNIKDFIKVRIPFNGTQICPILLNYSTNNIFILNYNNLNKFNDKSILYDGNIYKVTNGQNLYTKLVLRYFQITKNCFRYYNNIYSVLIYNNRPLVQFDIRHIDSIEIININLFNKTEEKKMQFVFSINLIKNSDFFIFATDDKEFGISIVNVLNLLKKYYEEDRDLFEYK